MARTPQSRVNFTDSNNTGVLKNSCRLYVYKTSMFRICISLICILLLRECYTEEAPYFCLSLLLCYCLPSPDPII